MNIAVVGAQWGDEGKGKIVDLLAQRFSIVARYQGGHNAGHTVHVGGRKFILRLIPSGILHSGVTCVIGNGVVVDLKALFDEVDELATAGIDVNGRLLVSDRAHVILPYHRDLDWLSEASLGARMIGTTSRGIGPAYEDKAGRRGLRVCDLADGAALEELVRDGVLRRNTLVQGEALRWEDVFSQARDLGARLRPWVGDVSVALTRAMAEGRSILFEGAQGTMLDLDLRDLPVRHVVERDGWRGVHRAWRRASFGARGARHREGVHDACRRRAVSIRTARRRRRGAARKGTRVRRRDRPPAPVRVVRRRAGQARRPGERSRCRRDHEDGRAGRPGRCADLRGLPHRRRRVRRVPGRPAPPAALHARARVDAGLVGAHGRCERHSAVCRRRRARTWSASSTRSACRCCSFRRARGATTPLSGTSRSRRRGSVRRCGS